MKNGNFNSVTTNFKDFIFKIGLLLLNLGT